MKVQKGHQNESDQVDISQCYSLFSTKVFLLLYFYQSSTRNTKREFDAKKTVNVADSHLIWLTQSAEASHLLLKCIVYGQYKEEWLQKGKHVSVSFWAAGCCFKTFENCKPVFKFYCDNYTSTMVQ